MAMMVFEKQPTLDDVYARPQDWSICGVFNHHVVYMDLRGRVLSVPLRTEEKTDAKTE